MPTPENLCFHRSFLSSPQGSGAAAPPSRPSETAHDRPGTPHRPSDTGPSSTSGPAGPAGPASKADGPAGKAPPRSRPGWNDATALPPPSTARPGGLLRDERKLEAQARAANGRAPARPATAGPLAAPTVRGAEPPHETPGGAPAPAANRRLKETTHVDVNGRIQFLRAGQPPPAATVTVSATPTAAAGAGAPAVTVKSSGTVGSGAALAAELAAKLASTLLANQQQKYSKEHEVLREVVMRQEEMIRQLASRMDSGRGPTAASVPVEDPSAPVAAAAAAPPKDLHFAPGPAAAAAAAPPSTSTVVRKFQPAFSTLEQHLNLDLSRKIEYELRAPAPAPPEHSARPLSARAVHDLDPTPQQRLDVVIPTVAVHAPFLSDEECGLLGGIASCLHVLFPGDAEDTSGVDVGAFLQQLALLLSTGDDAMLAALQDTLLDALRLRLRSAGKEEGSGGSDLLSRGETQPHALQMPAGARGEIAVAESGAAGRRPVSMDADALMQALRALAEKMKAKKKPVVSERSPSPGGGGGWNDRFHVGMAEGVARTRSGLVSRFRLKDDRGTTEMNLGAKQTLPDPRVAEEDSALVGLLERLLQSGQASGKPAGRKPDLKGKKPVGSGYGNRRPGSSLPARRPPSAPSAPGARSPVPLGQATIDRLERRMDEFARALGDRIEHSTPAVHRHTTASASASASATATKSGGPGAGTRRPSVPGSGPASRVASPPGPVHRTVSITARSPSALSLAPAVHPQPSAADSPADVAPPPPPAALAAHVDALTQRERAVWEKWFGPAGVQAERVAGRAAEQALSSAGTPTAHPSPLTLAAPPRPETASDVGVDTAIATSGGVAAMVSVQPHVRDAHDDESRGDAQLQASSLAEPTSAPLVGQRTVARILHHRSEFLRRQRMLDGIWHATSGGVPFDKVQAVEQATEECLAGLVSEQTRALGELADELVEGLLRSEFEMSGSASMMALSAEPAS